MTKKEYCNNNPGMAALATSAFDGYVVHGVEYGIDDRVYITYQINNKILSYHKLIIHYTKKNGSAFVRLHGKRLHMTEFYRIWYI